MSKKWGCFTMGDGSCAMNALLNILYEASCIKFGNISDDSGLEKFPINPRMLKFLVNQGLMIIEEGRDIDKRGIESRVYDMFLRDGDQRIPLGVLYHEEIGPRKAYDDFAVPKQLSSAAIEVLLQKALSPTGIVEEHYLLRDFPSLVKDRKITHEFVDGYKEDKDRLFTSENKRPSLQDDVESGSDTDRDSIEEGRNLDSEHDDNGASSTSYKKDEDRKSVSESISDIGDQSLQDGFEARDSSEGAETIESLDKECEDNILVTEMRLSEFLNKIENLPVVKRNKIDPKVEQTFKIPGTNFELQKPSHSLRVRYKMDCKQSIEKTMAIHLDAVTPICSGIVLPQDMKKASERSYLIEDLKDAYNQSLNTLNKKSQRSL